MSLDIAINSALSGLKVNQEIFGVISNNIANVNTENYTRRVVELTSNNIDGVGQGVSVSGIVRKVDAYLVGTVRSQNSKVNYTERLNEYYNTIQNLFGKPNDAGNLNSSIDNFFTSIRSLTSNPELASLRLNAINAGINVTDRISSLASDLQNLRYEADREIKTSVTEVNNLLFKLKNLNVALSKAYGSDSAAAGLMEERDNTLLKLSEFIDFQNYEKPDGQIYISTANGISLLDENNYELTYNPATSIDTFIAEAGLNAITVSVIREHAEKHSAERTLISGGVTNDISSLLKSGKIQGLKELRDSILPDIITQVDNLAINLRDEFNAIHNDGAGFPAATSLTGSREIINNDRRDWTGQVRIGIIDESGNSLTQVDGTLLNPLTLDLQKLSSGLATGQPYVSTIIDEINEYFYYSPTEDRLKLGNLDNIKMIATSDLSTTPNGQVSLDFEVENYSQLTSTFEVLDVKITDAGAAGLVSALPGITNIIAGTRGKAGAPIIVNFAGGAGGPYKVHAQIRVTDADGKVSVSTVEFIINDNPGSTAVLNDRYVSSAVIDGDATLVAAGTTQRFAKASIVDANGNDVAAGVPGFLKITTEKNNYRIVMDELNSQEQGVAFASMPYTAEHKGTNWGFSHYFGLNDFFVNNGATQENPRNAALNLKVRSDIPSNANLLSVGELTKTANYFKSQIVGDTTAVGSIEFNNNPDVNDTITINGQLFTFKAVAAANDEITIAGTLANTLDNIIAKLNASNSTTAGTADKAIYSNDGISRINLTFKSAGVLGNSFSFAANMATIGVSLNGDPISTSAANVLIGGSDKITSKEIIPYTYEITAGNNKAISRLAELGNKIFNFGSAGTLPSTSSSIVGYSANIISFNSFNAIRANDNYVNEDLIGNGFRQRFNSGSGVNLDEELASTVIYQNAYSANARVIKVTKELFDILINAT